MTGKSYQIIGSIASPVTKYVLYRRGKYRYCRTKSSNKTKAIRKHLLYLSHIQQVYTYTQSKSGNIEVEIIVCESAEHDRQCQQYKIRHGHLLFMSQYIYMNRRQQQYIQCLKKIHPYEHTVAYAHR